MSQFLYPIDMTGAAATNKVTGERHTLNPPVETRDYHFLLTRSGPFYRDTLVLTHETSGRTLVENLDWVPGHAFESASFETEYAKGGIFQSIVFLDRGLSGTILLNEYQVLGGEWSLDENKILEILSNRLHDPRSYSYEMVSGKPDTFPAIRHQHPGDDLVGQRQLVEAVTLISGRLNEQLTSLPPFLRNLLLNYYPKSVLDQMLIDLSATIIAQITGPEIETILFEQLDAILARYVLLAAYADTISDLTDQLSTVTNASNVNTNRLNGLDLALSSVNTALLQRPTLTVVQDYVNSQLGNVPSDIDFAIFQSEVNIRLDIFQTTLSDTMQPVQDLLSNMDLYVTKAEFLSLLPSSTIPSSATMPITVNTVEQVTGIIDGVYPITITSHFVNADGHIRNITIKSGDDQTLLVNKPSGTGYLDSLELNIIGSQHTWDFTANWAADGFADSNSAYTSRKTGVVPHSATQYALYLTIDWTAALPNGSYNSTMRLDKILNAGVPEQNKLIPKSSLRPNPTSRDDLLLAILGVTPEGGLYIKKMINRGDVQITETKSKILTRSEMLTQNNVSIDFMDRLGHNSLANILGVKFFDPNGVLMGVSGYYHDFIPCVSNKVTVLKPSIDMSSFDPTDTARIEVTVLTQTLR